MIGYEDWNREIFQHYFYKPQSSAIFFCVDDKAIEYIGKKLGLAKEDALKNFCCAVIEKCKRENTIDLALKVLIPKNGIPIQTAVIAFTILAASRMKNDTDLTAKNYWGRVKEIFALYAPRYTVITGWQKEKDSNPFVEMFQNFAKFVTNNYYDFEFPTLYNYAGKKNDLVGLPIYQSMISTNDRIILTKRFKKYQGYEYEKIVKDSNKSGENYSTAFQKNRDNNVNNQFYYRIMELYNDWQENGYEYDEYCELTKIRLKLGYKQVGIGKYRFFYFLKEDERLSKPEDFEIIYINGEKYYCKNVDDESLLAIKNQILNLNLNQEKRIESSTDKDFILLKNMGENYYLETKNVIVDDNFSILLNTDKNQQKIQESFEDGYFIESNDYYQNEINEKIILLHSFDAVNFNNDFIQINKKHRYNFRKGLKSEKGLYNYIQGAEPIFNFKDFEYIKVYCEDECVEKVKLSPFDVRKKHNKIDKKYHISFEKSNTNIPYQINKLNETLFKPRDFKYIYHNFSGGQLIKSFDYMPEDTICSGASLESFIDNKQSFLMEYAELNSSRTDYKKIAYIFYLLKMCKKKNKFPMPLEIVAWAENHVPENQIIKDVIKYVKRNKYIDNYAMIYFREMGKYIKWQNF